MIFYTYHDIDYDICIPSDVSKSEYYEDGYLKKAYNWLFEKINTNQVIWCYPEHRWPYYDHGTTWTQWKLNVPENEIIAYLSTDVWDSIINDLYHIPNNRYKSWEKEYNKDKGNFDDYIELMEKKFEEKNGPKDKWWVKNLFRKKVSKNCMMEILIPSPVKKEWIIDKTTFSFYNINECEHFDRYGIIRWFDSSEEADKFFEIILPLLNGRKIEYIITRTEKDIDGRIKIEINPKDQKGF